MARWEQWSPSAGAAHPDPLVERLQGAMGKGRVFVLAHPEGERAPRCLVQPETTGAVAAAVLVLRGAGVSIDVCLTPVPFDPPDFVAGAVYLDLERLGALLAVDETSLVATVQAGARFGALEGLLNRRGLTMGPIPACLADRCIAESVALNDRLRPSARYGQLTEAIQAVTAVLPTGQVARTVAAPRRATGPELPAALLGARHRNGYLTEVQLQVWRQPTERPRLAFEASTWRIADDLARSMLAAGIRPALHAASGAGPVVFGAELVTASDRESLERLVVGKGLSLRSQAPALEALRSDGKAPVLACVFPSDKLEAVTAALPGATCPDLGEPFLTLWTQKPLSDAVTRRLVKLGAMVPGAPSEFDVLNEALTRALGGR